MNRRATVMMIATLGVLSAAGVILGTNALGAGESQGPPTGTLDFDFVAGLERGVNPARGSKEPARVGTGGLAKRLRPNGSDG